MFSKTAGTRVLSGIYVFEFEVIFFESFCSRGSISPLVIAISKGKESFNGYLLRCLSDPPNPAKICVEVRKKTLIAPNIWETLISVWIQPLEGQKPQWVNLIGHEKIDV